MSLPVSFAWGGISDAYVNNMFHVLCLMSKHKCKKLKIAEFTIHRTETK